jgi:putative membrane-bound dehydrogenase-like protein
MTHASKNLAVSCLAAFLALVTPVSAADPAPASETKNNDSDLMKEVKFPAEFDAMIFARPPLVNYPVFVAAAPDGSLYVSSDGNGSLDRNLHRGRIVRLRDTDGDGRADEAKDFVKDVDSPRGLVWDHDRLYLLHPPHISVYIDKDGDGVADEEKVLVKNVAFTFKDRPADHSSNGLELGIDGWIYAAIGDFGFMEAEGTDGRKLQLRGGGVVRVRPDGTGLELFARGTRNILEAAVSPLLDIVARDNTNDGGGWDIRFHHFTGLTEHGYPTLFKNFRGEFIEPLADYGGGSGCGAGWIDEPGIPAKWNNAPFTCDWGRNWVYHHRLTPNGATFSLNQTEFVGATRVTDLDVDALSHIYVASWKGATFNWAGPNVGYIVRLAPKGYQPEALPNFAAATDGELIKLLESPSHRRRLEAQRIIVRRGLPGGTAGALTAVAADPGKPLATRVAAVFALKQGLGEKSIDALAKLAGDSTIAAWAIRALTDRENQLAGVPAAPVLAGLTSNDARTRNEAVVSAARLGKLEQAVLVTPLLNDRDSVITHSAEQTLRRLKADAACFAVVDAPASTPQERAGALRVLQSLHETRVADGLIARLAKESDLTRRQGLLVALCRLHSIDGPWKGNSWGTRPDTRGPYYQPEDWAETKKIAAALSETLAKADAAEAVFLALQFNRHRIEPGNAAERLLELAAKDATVLTAIVGQFARAESVSTAIVPLLVKAAAAADSVESVRAQAVIALAKSETGADGVQAMLTALAKLGQSKSEDPFLEQAREAFFNSPAVERQRATLVTEAAKLAGDASLWADAALLRSLDRRAPQGRRGGGANPSTTALETGWAEPKRRAQIIAAAALTGRRVWTDKILAAVNDPDAAVAAAARTTVAALKLELPKPADNASPLIGALKLDDVLAAVLQTHGDPKRGAEIFTQQGCVACHTTRADEPLKGPFLGNIATLYKRRELAEAVLLPNKTIAQGFAANRFVLKDGTEVEGFVVTEAADKVTIRTVAAQEMAIRPGDIGERSKLEKSLMPEGLVGNLPVNDFAALLDYLEGLAK